MSASLDFAPALMTRVQAAHYVGLSPSEFDRRRNAGYIIPVYDGGPKFPKVELDRYVKTHPKDSK